MDLKWFTYEEILNMKENLRAPLFIINAIEASLNNNVLPLNTINIIE